MYNHKLGKKDVTHAIVITLVLSGCTGQTLDSFRFAQQNETYNVFFNSKVDILFVIDNSASMDTSQRKLRSGFATFADKYMIPTWDINVAVTTTDAYLANSVFSGYLNTVIPGSVNYTSTYLTNNKASWVNPSWNSSLFNTGTGRFTNGIKYKELVPHWGADGRKPSMLHADDSDGPRAGICNEVLPTTRFSSTTTVAPNCMLRDFSLTLTGTAECLNPTGGRTTESMCMNTLQNNTVHTGKAIIKTPGANNATWKQQLLDDFKINVTAGSAGHGSSREFSSVTQFLTDNEVVGNSYKFFRQDSIRVIIFVSDTDDQSMTLPASPPAGYTPFTDYGCDQAKLVADNGAAPITGANGYCCTAAGCSFGQNNITSCPSKTVGSTTYAMSVCPDPAKLTSVSAFKSSLDTFFHNLDGTSSSSNANYIVDNIVVTSESSLLSALAAQDTEATAVGDLKRYSSDYATRLISLANQVGNGSQSMDITSSDYTPLLNSIGSALSQLRATFTLTHPATNQGDMIVRMVHANGTASVLRNDQYSISGDKLTITDVDFILSLVDTDKLNVDYQPSSI